MCTKEREEKKEEKIHNKVVVCLAVAAALGHIYVGNGEPQQSAIIVLLPLMVPMSCGNSSNCLSRPRESHRSFCC